ncbi:MAG: hypothetical protein QXD48_02315 [Candidatus Aenigmatarchaeota archaeon]
MRIKCFLIFISIFVILQGIVYAANGTIIYGDTINPGVLKVRDYTYPSSNGIEYSTVSTSSSQIYFAKIVATWKKNEKFVAHLKADGRLDVLRCVDGCDQQSDWSLIGTLTGATSTTNANKMAFDIAYENTTGRAMIVFADDPTTNYAYYCLWNGTGWSPTPACGSTFSPGASNSIMLDGIGVPLWIKLVPRGDDMLLGVSGTTGFGVARWNGSTWIHNITISESTLAATAQPAFGIVWESISGNGLVVFDLTTLDGTTYYRKYNPITGWDTTNTAGPDTGAGNNLWIELASDPSSNRISMAIADSENDAHLYIWKADGSTEGFTTTATNPIDGTIETTTGKTIGTTWTRTTSHALFSYTDSNALTQDVVCWTPSGFTGITADVGGSNTDDVDQVVIVGPSPDNEDSFILRGDIVDDLIGNRWDGSGCGSTAFTRIPSTGTLTASLSATTDNSAPLPFWFAYDLYSDEISPTIEIQLPINVTYNTTIIPLNYTVTDNIEIDKCKYSIDGGENITIPGCVNITIDVGQGWHELFVFVNDTNNNNASASVNFSIDSIPPEIIFVAPTPNNETIDVNNTYINVTLSEIPDWIQLEWNGTNETMDGNEFNWYKNKTNLVNGNYTFKVYANDSVGNMNVSEIRWVYINYFRYLEVNITYPPTLSTIDIIQNNTFIVNATVICRGGNCGNVNGTIRYNFSSPETDTPINTTEGDKPFYIFEIPRNATKDCGELNKNQQCNLSWIINATGDIGSDWRIDVLFNSSDQEIQSNNTDDISISIFSCSIDFNLQWSHIDFGELNPNTKENPAPGNDKNKYNITVNPGSCNLDFYIRGTNLTNSTLNSIIGVGNITWSNVSNSYSTSKELKHTYTPIRTNVTKNTNITTWYWLNVPPIYAGRYTGTIIITGVKNGENP